MFQIKVTFLHGLLAFRWLQIAKKIISKSKRDSDGDQSKTLGPARVVRRPPLYPSSHHGGPGPVPIYGSENDLSLAYNSIGRGVRYSPEGRTSPEVQMYKTRVIYHSRQDCLDDHQASV